ncbi:MAG: DUF2304 domain-containing protein [bacterium]
MLIQIIFSLSFAIALFTTWKRFREDAVRFAEACIWSLLWFAALLIVWWPGFVSFLAGKVGVGRGADLVIYSSIIIIFWLIFRVFVRLEAIERQTSALIRAEALHEFDNELAKEK